jgi:hypothetical protein
MNSQSMKDEIKRISGELGFEINFEPDGDLKKLRKGKTLLMRELRALPDSSAVYVTYKEYGSAGYRINSAMRITRLEGPECWSLDDGSSFGAEFKPVESADTEPCVDDCCGEGIMYLFHIVK